MTLTVKRFVICQQCQGWSSSSKRASGNHIPADCAFCNGKGGTIETLTASPDVTVPHFQADAGARFVWLAEFGMWWCNVSRFLYSDEFVRYWFGYAMEAV